MENPGKTPDSISSSPAKSVGDDSSPPESVEMVDHEESSSSGSSEKDADNDNKSSKVGAKSTGCTFQKSTASSLDSHLFGIIACTRSGLAAKRSTFRVDTWVDVALTLDGRDKLTKFLQYTARLLAWYWMGTTQQQRFAALKQSLVSSRKTFRLGRSVIELHRLREQHTSSPTEKNQSSGSGSQTNPGVSSNIKHDPKAQEEAKRNSSSLLSRLSRHVLTDGPTTVASAVEKIFADVRLLGLAGYWALDNTSFLAASGLWDNYQVDSKTRASQRQSVQQKAGEYANRSYFVAAITGLWLNFKALQSFRTTECTAAQGFQEKSSDELAKLQVKYFNLCLALLKSACDVLVFSNNPGVDLWKNHYGSKLNEFVHCIAGLASASVVLYKNLPKP